MKKWIGLVLVLGLIAFGWYMARTYWRITPSWNQPKLSKVERGDIRVPITASGLIQPLARIEIKSEASGQVTEVKVQPGDYVKAGDVLVMLSRDDEQRNVERAQANLQRIRAQLEQAKEAKVKAQAAILTAEARVDELQANGRMTAFELEKITISTSNFSEQEKLNAEARDAMNKAQLKAAQANLTSAKASLSDADFAITIAEANVVDAEKTLAEAQERLEETTIVAPLDAIVTDCSVEVGNLIQSGKSGFSLGTPLMTLADISKYIVISRVDEADYGRVLEVAPVDALPEIEGLRAAAQEDAAALEKRSGKVKLTVDAFPEDTFEGRVIRAEPQGKLNAGASVIQFDVHVEVTDARRFLLPLGTQAQVEFTVESVSDVLTVPAEAVKSFQGERGLWVKTRATDGSNDIRPKFVPSRFGVSDGAVTQLIEVSDPGVTVQEGTEVYTKLPVDNDRD